MPFTVYILFSESLQTYYTGQTNNLADRLFRHNAGHEIYTQKGCPWNLVWSESVETRKEAVSLEKKIKGRGAGRFLNGLNL